MPEIIVPDESPDEMIPTDEEAEGMNEMLADAHLEDEPAEEADVEDVAERLSREAEAAAAAMPPLPTNPEERQAEILRRGAAAVALYRESHPRKGRKRKVDPMPTETPNPTPDAAEQPATATTCPVTPPPVLNAPGPAIPSTTAGMIRVELQRLFGLMLGKMVEVFDTIEVEDAAPAVAMPRGGNGVSKRGRKPKVSADGVRLKKDGTPAKKPGRKPMGAKPEKAPKAPKKAKEPKVAKAAKAPKAEKKPRKVAAPKVVDGVRLKKDGTPAKKPGRKPQPK